MESVTQEAAGIVEKRREHYGDPLPNHQRIAGFWSVVFGHPVTPLQVIQCMRLVKESRLIETPGHRDSLVDICGYADCQDVVNTAIDIAAYKQLEKAETSRATGQKDHGSGQAVETGISITTEANGSCEITRHYSPR
jgi:hypothetical protein